MKKKLLYILIILLLGVGSFYISYKVSVNHYKNNTGEVVIKKNMEKLENMYFDSFNTEFLNELDKMSEEDERGIEIMSREYLMNRSNSNLRNISCSDFEDCTNIKDSLNVAADAIMRRAKKEFKSVYSEPRNVGDGFFVDLEIKGMNMDMLLYDIDAISTMTIQNKFTEKEIGEMSYSKYDYEYAKIKADVVKYLADNKLDDYITNNVKGSIYWENIDGKYYLEGITTYYVFVSGSKDTNFVPLFTNESDDEVNQIYADYEKRNMERAEKIYKEMNKKAS